MRNAIIACTMAVLTAGSVALPALADDVFVTGQRSYDDGYDNDNGYRHHRHRPGIVINERGVTFGSAEQRDHYRNRDRCSTRTMTRQTDDGSEVTKTIRRCD